MADIRELFVSGNGKGWVHLKRFAYRDRIDIPKESFDFMVKLAENLLREETQLEEEDANRTEKNRRLTDVAMEKLEILIPSRGRTPLNSMTQIELEKTVQWRRAMDIREVLWKNPCMAESEAIQVVAKKCGTDEDTREIRRAWNNIKFRLGEDLITNSVRKSMCAEIQIRQIRPELYDLIQKGHVTTNTRFTLKPPFSSVDCDLQPPLAPINARDSLPKLLARILVNDQGEIDTLKRVKDWNSPRQLALAKQIVEHLKKRG